MKQVKFPGGKKKEKQKYEAEPMIVLPSAPTESVTQYSIHLASSNADKTLDEMDMLRHITSHLNEIVYSMEHVYEEEVKKKDEEEEAEEEETPPKDEYEDMATFLMCCSQLRNQLESALREEKLILESLLQWFEKEVHEMEELGEERVIPDWQVPMADKNVTDNISKLMDRIQRLEELKGRVLELPKLIQLAVPKQERRKPPSPVIPSQRDPRHIVEELALKHGTEDVINMAQVFQEDLGPQTIETMTNRMLEIVKVFERQTNKLHRVTNEQEVLESKLQRIQQEYRLLSEEKEIMEDELQKMKTSETTPVPETKKKVLAKLEKAKEEKLHAAEKPQKGPLILRQRETEQQMKMKEDLAKAQATVQSLEEEKKMLEEMLQKALEEAGKVKVQLAEIPPTIPDWQFPYKTVGEDDKAQQRATKAKLPSEPDRTPQKRQTEILPEKSPDVVTESQAKDIKQKKKGPVGLDTEKGLSEGAPASEKKTEEQKKKASKFEETKRRRSTLKGS